MNYELITHYSSLLNRDMQVAVYGHSGKIMLAFAAQDGKHNNFADFGMVEALAPWIEAGKLIVVSPDSIDEETWSAKDNDPGYRCMLQETWFRYVCEEVVPMMKYKFNNFDKMWTTGCSMGGFHATNFMLRRPDLFDGCIALSGAYDMSMFIENYMDENFYNNSPVYYMRGMPSDHPYIEQYNNSKIIICSGQGAWEEDLLIGNRELNGIMSSKGIHAWFDYWGFDVNHDWPWWRKQIVYFMEKMI